MSHLKTIFIIIALTLMTAGCGERGPKTYSVSGTVTFNGKPVPVGQIFFQPDMSEGNRGPGCTVKIKNGRYDTTQAGSGHIGGPHVLVISGGEDQSSLPPEQQLARRDWFREIQVKLDLPLSESVQDVKLSQQ